MEGELQHKVFLTCLRLCTCKESPDDYMDPEAFGNILYDNWLMDIPRYIIIQKGLGRNLRDIA